MAIKRRLASSFRCLRVESVSIGVRCARNVVFLSKWHSYRCLRRWRGDNTERQRAQNTHKQAGASRFDDYYFDPEEKKEEKKKKKSEEETSVQMPIILGVRTSDWKCHRRWQFGTFLLLIIAVRRCTIEPNVVWLRCSEKKDWFRQFTNMHVDRSRARERERREKSN